ncbi:CFI-box-CTERM domain-containing protein [Thiohalomonas denitrificans]|uniref:Conserved repeat domain-containing protein n=1 Tax=Thiohalomonas denitrificans TaxID=415747 RepID=A0A1G5Q2X9_9GAMM|nr:CFI-box-CTERM domain-containing protein [Thiohalomonas denitrificans]SCZ56173.1 conserved repeat domain-containing protein [Thiohalomonas denitrificans]
MKTTTQAALVGIISLGPGLARAEADVSVTKTATPEIAVENRSIDYRIVITNLGPDVAQRVELVDDLPEEVGLLQIDSRCIVETPTRLRCLLGNIAENENRIIEIQTRADAITELPPVQRIITNRAGIEPREDDPFFDNDADEVDVVVVPEEDAADLSLNLSSRIIDNGDVQFTLEVFNNSALGVDNVTTIFRMDELALSELSEISSTRGSCLTPRDTCIGEECEGIENEPIEVICNLGTLTATATERAFITVFRQSSESLSATAEVSGDRADPNLDNNSDTEITDRTGITIALDQISGGCIASRLAAGRPIERDLNHLRRARDRMKRFAWGRRFVAAYYHSSPALSRYIGRHPHLAVFARILLKPVIFIARRL